MCDIKKYISELDTLEDQYINTWNKLQELQFKRFKDEYGHLFDIHLQCGSISGYLVNEPKSCQNLPYIMEMGYGLILEIKTDYSKHVYDVHKEYLKIFETGELALLYKK